MKKENIIVTKSFDFALHIIELYKQLVEQKEYVFPSNYYEAVRVSVQMFRKQLLHYLKKILQQKCQSHQKKQEKQNIGCNCLIEVN